jgi:hypothetical protein
MFFLPFPDFVFGVCIHGKVFKKGAACQNFAFFESSSTTYINAGHFKAEVVPFFAGFDPTVAWSSASTKTSTRT